MAAGIDTQYRGPVSAYNTQSMDSRTKFLTEVGDGYVTQGFARNLESFYNKASEQDRKRCIHLLASLALGEGINKAVVKQEDKKLRRPKTAGASFGGRRPDTSDRSYKERPKSGLQKKTATTYRSKYPAKEIESTKPIVPPSTDDMFRPTLDPRAKVGDSTYSAEFYNKGYNRADLIPSGSASGNRRNNPHPFKSFIVWKFPKGAQQQQKEQKSHRRRDLTDRMMDEVLADKCSSTYQNDYLGIPQGFQMKSAFEEDMPEEHKPHFTLDSTMRFSYQYPKKKNELQANISNRYGCYRHLHLPATGIVPTAANEQNMRTFTSYDQFFNRPYKPGQAEISEAVQTGKIGEYMRLANDKERDVLTKMIGDHVRRPRTPSPKYHPRPPSSQSSQPPSNNLTFISGWTGPM